MAVKVSNQDCGLRKDWWQICVVPVFSWWFVNVGNVISAHMNDITARRRRHTRSIRLRDVAVNICRTSMFGMECVADDVETWDCEAVGLVIIDVCLLEANDVNVMDLCQWLYDVMFCCWQPLDVELHDTRGRTYGLKAQFGVIGGVFTGFVALRIRFAGGIFGFPRLVYSLRYSRGGRQGRRLPSPHSVMLTDGADRRRYDRPPTTRDFKGSYRALSEFPCPAGQSSLEGRAVTRCASFAAWNVL